MTKEEKEGKLLQFVAKKIKVLSIQPSDHSFDYALCCATKDGWVDIVSLCSNYVVSRLGGSTRNLEGAREILDETADLLNIAFTQRGIYVRVGFVMVTADAIKIDVSVPFPRPSR